MDADGSGTLDLNDLRAVGSGIRHRLDVDGDGVLDFTDQDTNNDGMIDSNDDGFLDADGDGMADNSESSDPPNSDVTEDLDDGMPWDFEVKEKADKAFLKNDTNKEEKEKLRELIKAYFNLSFSDSRDEYSFLSDYESENIENFFNDDSESKFQKLADEIINQFGDIVFSRLLSNNYFLNQREEDVSITSLNIDFDKKFKN